MSEALSPLGAQVRAADPERFYAALFAPAEKREALFALLAFNHEIARVREVVSEGIIGQMRLAWWHEAIAEIAAGKLLRAHPVVAALAAAHRAQSFSFSLLDRLIDARSFDLYDDPMTDIEALEAYAVATGGGLHRAMAEALGAIEPGLTAAEAVGTAWALTGIVRALKIHSSRRQLYLPLDALNRRGISVEAVFAGQRSVGLRDVIAEIVTRANQWLARAKGVKLRAALPAAMPGALLGAHWRYMTSRTYNPFTASDTPASIARMVTLLAAGLRGQI